MPAMALSRVAARVVESGPDGENLAPGAWQRLEALPDPRSPQGRIYPLACLIAIAVCAFTAAGNDRFTAVGQWIKRAGQADLARLHAPWDPIAGRYRAPDEKTIRVVLDRLDPRALTRALLGPRPRGAGAAAGRPRPACAATGPGAPPSRRRTLARARLRAVAVDGKTSRGGPGTAGARLRGPRVRAAPRRRPDRGVPGDRDPPVGAGRDPVRRWRPGTQRRGPVARRDHGAGQGPQDRVVKIGFAGGPQPGPVPARPRQARPGVAAAVARGRQPGADDR